jgi:hypothetical protein
VGSAATRRAGPAQVAAASAGHAAGNGSPGAAGRPKRGRLLRGLANGPLTVRPTPLTLRDLLGNLERLNDRRRAGIVTA